MEKIFYETRDLFDTWTQGNKDPKCTLKFCAGEKCFMKPEMFLKRGNKETRTLSVPYYFVLEKNIL